MIEVGGVVLGALMIAGCGQRGPGAKVPVGTATITAAPLEPDTQFTMPGTATWEDDAEAPINVVETWGARPATPDELEKYGF